MSDISIAGIFPGDVIIKTAIELGLKDMRENEWVIEDVFIPFFSLPILREKYGYKYINTAKEWILKNKIEVFLGSRVDLQHFPAVIIDVGPESEDDSKATLGDQSAFSEEYEASEVGKKIPYIIDPFTPEAYDKIQGEITIPEGVEGFGCVSNSMLLLDIDSCTAHQIIEKKDDNIIVIAANTALGNKVAVIPSHNTFKSRRERSISNQTYEIHCMCVGDPNNTIILYSLIKYILWRYKEGLLENNGFQNTTISSGALIQANFMKTENVWTREIRLSGEIEESWVKSPKGYIESVCVIDPDNVGTEEEAGIKILSNEVNFPYNNGLWLPIEDDGDEE